MKSLPQPARGKIKRAADASHFFIDLHVAVNSSIEVERALREVGDSTCTDLARQIEALRNQMRLAYAAIVEATHSEVS
ncbi:MAG: hypothetical protein ACOC3G_07830 [Phycisphaeraceae bacterium]